jgi:hypothetical protein
MNLNSLRYNVNNKIRTILGVKPKQMIGYHRYILNPFRKYPDFIIIGSQKAASTFLHHYLSLNTNIKPPPIKETQFFNMNYDRGLSYYKSIFPIYKKGKMTFESTPDYLSHPLAPELCYKLLPNIKIIVTLRNPVERAFSHFNFVKSYGGEPKDMTFEKALSLETDRINDQLNLMESNRYNSAAIISRYGYKRNGEYSIHIKKWLEYYPIESFKFIDFDNIKKNKEEVLIDLCQFIEIPFEKVMSSSIKNKSIYNTKISEKTIKELSEYYNSHNTELYNIIGKKLNW